MDYGLQTLTADQCIELLQEVLQELTRRDHVARQVAQQTIDQAAEVKRAQAEAFGEALEKLHKEHVAGLKKEIEDEMRRDLQNGSLRLLNAEEEAALVKEAALEARIRLIDEAMASLKSGKAPSDRFFLEIRGDTITMALNNRRVQTKHALTSAAIADLSERLHRVLG